jgi:hypothetical protein
MINPMFIMPSLVFGLDLLQLFMYLLMYMLDLLNEPIVPWLWKQANIKEEKEKCELHGRHSDCYWVEVSKREENMEQIKRKQDVGRGDRG